MRTRSLDMRCCKAETERQKESTSGSPMLSSLTWVGVPIERRVAASMRCVTLEMRLKILCLMSFVYFFTVALKIYLMIKYWNFWISILDARTCHQKYSWIFLPAIIIAFSTISDQLPIKRRVDDFCYPLMLSGGSGSRSSVWWNRRIFPTCRRRSTARTAQTVGSLVFFQLKLK